MPGNEIGGAQNRVKPLSKPLGSKHDRQPASEARAVTVLRIYHAVTRLWRSTKSLRLEVPPSTDKLNFQALLPIFVHHLNLIQSHSQATTGRLAVLIIRHAKN